MKSIQLMTNKNIITIFPLLINSFFFGQINECDDQVPSSIEKLYLKGKNYKKYDYQNRLKFLKDAIEIEEENIPCIFELAKTSFRRKYGNGGSMELPKKYFLQIETLCSSYHADIFYYLSLIYYMDKDDCKAVEYFKKFLEFSSENKNSFSSNYLFQKKNIEELFKMSIYFCDFYSNPVPFEPKIVRNISTAERNEILPVISPDNEHIYYTIEFDEYIKGDISVHHEQLFARGSRNSFNEDFNIGKPLKEPFNMGPKYGGASMSVNNKEMYICACINNGGYFNCDIYFTKKQLKETSILKEGVKFDTAFYVWSPLINLGPNINGSQTWEGQPSLSGDGNTLFFSSARPGGFGKTDIYYSVKNEDGTWQKAINIGESINTSKSDKSPFIHTDSKTLYFSSESSDSRWGAGGFDIFFTKQDLETKKWNLPKNIGFPINSDQDEESLVVSLDGHFGYFSSNRENGLGGKDIFYFEIPEQAKPDKIILVKGNATLDDNTKIVLVDNNGNKKEQGYNLDDEGKFVVVVNVESIKGDALLNVESKDGVFESIVISQEDIKSTVVKNKIIENKKIEKGKPYTLNNIMFESNSSSIKASSKIVLDEFADWLKKKNSINIEIQGHTDDQGSEKENLALSIDRAFSVMEYLLNKGIDKKRLKFTGFGESKPKVSNKSSMLRSINRRTDFLIF